MSFIEFSPKWARREGRTSIPITYTFYKIKKTKCDSHCIRISINKDICEKAGIKGADKVCFLYDEENPHIWLIKKSNSDAGYKIMELKNTHRLRLQVSGWDLSIPQDRELRVVCAPYDYHEGGIRIFALKP